jgi:hypothetical protein
MRRGAAAYAARAFGHARQDLDIDLADADRPGLISRLLLGGMIEFDASPDAADRVWAWTIEERLQALLAIAIATCPAPPPWRTRCQEAACRGAMEIAIDPASFVAAPRRDTLSWRAADGSAVTARLPRGADQRRWRQARVVDAAALAAPLVEAVDGRPPEATWRVPEAWLDGLAEAFTERDPLTALQLVAACPSCGATNRIDFDLEGWLLGLLAAEQRRLIDDVHALASAYHWSEAEICALPAWRRRAYLARVAAEAAS